MPPQRQRRNSLHPLQCMIWIAIGAVVLLVVVIILLGVVRAISLDGSHAHHADDDELTSHYHHMKQDKRHVPAELHTLEALEEVTADGSTLSQGGWLPNDSGRRKRGSLRDLDPFTEHAAHEARRSAHVLDLRSAQRISDDTYFLGVHPHPKHPDQMLQSYAFVHKASNGDDARHDALSKVERTEKKAHFNRTEADVLRHHQRKRQVIECGAPIALGARWKHAEGYFVHPLNAGGFDTATVIEHTEKAMDEWRCVFNSIHIEPIGPLLGIVLDEDEDALDLKRPQGSSHVAFARLRLPDGNSDSTLAVTITRGVFAGPIDERYISEFTTLFNDEYYTFGDCAVVGNTCKRDGTIDYMSIATHELGHAFGLDDLYSTECVDNTMFWSAKAGETNKRTLEEEDKLSMIAHYTQPSQ